LILFAKTSSETYIFLWKCLKTHGFGFKTVKIWEKAMEINGNRWKSMKNQ
jgi:hypothetical protein